MISNDKSTKNLIEGAEAPSQAQQSIFRLEECAEYLRIAPQTLRNWVCAKKIPYTKVNNKILLFRRETIDAWLQAQEVKDIS